MIFKKNQQGQILLFSVIAVAIVLFSTLFMIAGAQLYSQNTAYKFESEKVLALAEAGLEKAVASLNSTGGNYTGEPEVSLGEGTYSVVVASKDISTKTIEATGYIPNKSNPKIKKTIKIEASKGVGASFFYGIQVGEGGLYMEQQSSVMGSIYSNGSIVLDQHTTITGDAIAAAGTQPIADQENDCTIEPCNTPSINYYFFGKNHNGESRYDVMQSFQPASTATVNIVELKLQKIGNPNYDLNIKITTDENGQPDKNNVIATATIPRSLVPTSSHQFIQAVVSPNPVLNANSTYWIVVDTNSLNNSSYYSWYKGSIQEYNRGVARWSPNWTGATFNNINEDFGFKVFMGGVINTIKGNGNVVLIEGNAQAYHLENISIGGEAKYQTSQSITAGTYVPNQDPPSPKAMPISEGVIDDWKQEAESAGVYTGDITNCPQSLPAGKYIGSVILPDHCTLTVGSPIWITENFTLNQQSKLRLDSSFGSSSGIFVVGNFITLVQQTHIQGSCWQDICDNGSYLFLMSEFNSRDDPLERNAIHVQQQGNTGVLYSNLGKIRVEQQNNFTEISAWKLSLGQQLIISYNQGLASTFFSSGPSGAYSIVKGTYQIK